jgi:hypothetical protein
MNNKFGNSWIYLTGINSTFEAINIKPTQDMKFKVFKRVNDIQVSNEVIIYYYYIIFSV